MRLELVDDDEVPVGAACSDLTILDGKRVVIRGGENLQKITYRPVSLSRMTKGPVRVQLVLVAPTDAFPGEVALLLQVHQDGLYRSLGDPHEDGNVSHPGMRVSAQGHHDVAMVAEEGPLFGRRRLVHRVGPFQLTRKHFAETCTSSVGGDMFEECRHRHC